MKNKIILVGGYCATGKSTFSRMLADNLKAPCFNKDTLKETLGDGFGPESGEVFQKGSAVTFRLMLHIAECFLKSGSLCILESNFKPNEIEQLKELLKKYRCECLTFAFESDLDVLYDRYAKRDGERHWVHKQAGTSREAFKEGQLPLGHVRLGRTICVDTTSFEEVDYEPLMAAARNFVEETA